ncbi:MAG: sodium:proline symporter, partial [Rhizobiales bacterium]|nr:sodium:proline symporter [Hyphomicrobiales bacterium]
MEPILLTAMIAITAVSYVLSPKVRTVEGFFHGTSETLQPPGLWTLVMSQVTTWIFARSLQNAAILGFYYGIWGSLAYALYYLSFLTGGQIIEH